MKTPPHFPRTRRQVLGTAVRAGLLVPAPWLLSLRSGFGADGRSDQDRATDDQSGAGIEVNDIQSQLNPTMVRAIATPQDSEELPALVHRARRNDQVISLAGGRHAMGGQQFGTDTLLLDLRGCRKVIGLDQERGIVEAEAGIQWPDLMDWLDQAQPHDPHPWCIRQKQTGVDHVTLGGSLAANIHGRGLRFAPFVQDIESFDLIDARGETRRCSRTEQPELFALAIGGYGLFGVVARVRLRLVRRQTVERRVAVIPVADMLEQLDQRIEAGAVYGDLQFSTHLAGKASQHPAVLATYHPIDNRLPAGSDPQHEDGHLSLTEQEWAELYRLGRSNKSEAFKRYSQYYLSTNGQRYLSDRHQLAGSFVGHRLAVDPERGTEMITEVYVHRDRLMALISDLRRDFIEHDVDLTYGTIRLCEPDRETFLAWATEPVVCIVFNLHVRRTEAGVNRAQADFRRIIDRAIEHGGRHFLTYHRWAQRRQLEAAYPQLAEFLKLKRHHDPEQRFQSDWYRHHRDLLLA